MSNMNNAISELERRKNHQHSGDQQNPKMFAMIALLVIATIAGIAQIRFLPSFSSSDLSCILFRFG